MLYAGLDIHKEYSQAVLSTKSGEILKEERIKSDKEDLEEFFSGFKNVKVVFEATSNYEYFFDILEPICTKIILAHPQKTRAIADARIKTDKIDARTLVHLLRANLIPTSYVPPKDIRELRKIVRHRIFLGRYRGQIKNRIRAELNRKGTKYPGKGLFALKGIKWLNQLNTSLINSHITIYQSIDNEIKAFELKINTIAQNYPNILLLTTIPGIGNYSAMLIYSEIGNINRFHSEDKLFSYAGLIPSVHQSGNNAYYGSITKYGSKYLRWILVESARTHIRCCQESKLTKYYYRLEKHKPGNVAIIATARKMLQIIYHMLKNKTTFHY